MHLRPLPRWSRIRRLYCAKKFEKLANPTDVYVPREPCASKIDQSKVEEPPEFNKALITHLERLSLVRFTNEEAVINLKKAVRYANQLKLLDVSNVEPLESVLEDVNCPLRDDVVNNVLTKEEVLMNSAEVVEDYFVTPPGNIKLEESDRIDFTKVQNLSSKVKKSHQKVKKSTANKHMKLDY